MSTSTEEIDLVSDIGGILNANSSISYLKNCVSQGSIYATKGYLTKSQSYHVDSVNKTWIRLVKLNKVSMKRFFDYHNSHSRYNNDPETFLNIFNPIAVANSRYDPNSDISSMFYMGCNVDKDIKISGYHYNINDIFNSYCLESARTDSRTFNFQYFVYKLIYISDKNFLIAMIDKNAILYIDEILLLKLKKSDPDKYTEIVIKILSIYANANSVFFSLNTPQIDKSLINYVGQYLMTKINHTSKDCMIIPPEHIDLFNDNNHVENLVSKLTKIVNDSVDTALRNTRWGVNNQYSYKKLIDEIICAKDSSIKKRCEKSFYQGLQLGTKFELAGWELSDQYNSQGVSWEKTVDIVPNRFCYRSKIYTIRNNDPDFVNPYRITKLFVDCDGHMFCEGTHPNVSSGHVCMGDISGKIIMTDIKELQKNLNRCEQLLYLINYDSPYQSSEMQKIRDDIIANHSEISEFDKVYDDDFVGDGDIVTDIQYENDSENNVKPEDMPVEDDSDIEVLE